MVTRISQMITKEKMLWSFIKLSQLISREMYEYQYREFVCEYLGGLRLYLGIEAVSCRLLRRDGKGAHGWILKKSWAIFFFKF